MDLELAESALPSRQLDKIYKAKEEGKSIFPCIPEKQRSRGRWWSTEKQNQWKEEAINMVMSRLANRLLRREITPAEVREDQVSEFRQRWRLVFDRMVSVHTVARCSTVESVSLTNFTTCVLAPLLEGERCFKARWGYRRHDTWENPECYFSS